MVRRGVARGRVGRRPEIWRYPLPRTGSIPRRGSFKPQGLRAMENGENDTPSRGGASNIIPFRRPAAPAVTPRRLPPRPVLWLDEGQLGRPPPQGKQALAAGPQRKSGPDKRLFPPPPRPPPG